MSLIQIAAPLIRLAAADDGYAQDLRDAIASDDRAYGGLVSAEIRPTELQWLKPTEWQWFANWRQSLGGELDPVVLSHLGISAGSRFARFEVRALTLRDPSTNELASEDTYVPDADNSVGLQWLVGQIHEPRVDPTELARDSLQCATEASWFVLRQLTSLDDRDRANRVIQMLDDFATFSEIDPVLTSRWRYHT
jgi:hypothetical protein